MHKIKFKPINIPIEFKEINPVDFNSEVYTVNEKYNIEINEQGYISDKFSSYFKDSYDKKSTVVINAGVGQGKSTKLIKLIDNYIKLDEYVVVLAVPFKSLIKQYFKDCEIMTSADKSQIFNYLNLDDYYYDSEVTLSTEELWSTYISDDDVLKKVNFSRYKIHIVTINGILGNSGNEFLFQASKKSDYFYSLRRYCEDENKKMILIFDEIHAGIHNFKEEYIFNLWNFKEVIQKIYIASATYNEASKEVIKYLSELTEYNIDIYESERKQISERQSRLNLLFNYENKISQNKNFIELVENLMKKDEPFDIITYSTRLADEIESELIKIIPDTNKLNLCHSKIKSSKKYEGRFIKERINIGTNFSTGVNIECDNHTLFIFLPSKSENLLLNTNGIFTTGNIAIIQALARQRKVGDIWIVMEEPTFIDFEYTKFNKKIQSEFHDIYKDFHLINRKVNYTDINNEKKVLDDLYIKYSSKNGEAKININTHRKSNADIRLLFPTKEIFTIERGEKELTKLFFNADFSTYVFWAAISNQFLNCKLHSIVNKSIIVFETDDLNKEMLKLYEDLKKTLTKNETVNEKVKLNVSYQIFIDLKNLIEKSDIIHNGNKINDNYTLITILINIILNKGNIDENDYSNRLNKDLTLNRYLISNLSSARSYDKKNNFYLTESKKEILMTYYKEWIRFFHILEIHYKISENKNTLPTKPFKEFVDLYNSLDFRNKILDIVKHDDILNSNIFPLKGTLLKYQREKKYDSILKYFYKLNVDIFFQYEIKHLTIRGKRDRYFEIKKVNNPVDVNILFKRKEIALQ